MYTEKTTIHETEDKDGNITTDTVKETRTICKNSGEPDYIKIYTDMWCDFNQIPIKWRELFVQLAIRMTYADASDKSNSGGQIVAVGGPIRDDIMSMLGWKNRQTFQKGLRELKNCGAIRMISRGFYQINPSYAGRGLWKYNPSKEQGGIENIKVYFDLKNKEVDTHIEWAMPEDTENPDLHGDITVEHTEVRDADGNNYSSDMEGYVAHAKGA